MTPLGRGQSRWLNFSEPSLWRSRGRASNASRCLRSGPPRSPRSAAHRRSAARRKTRGLRGGHGGSPPRRVAGLCRHVHQREKYSPLDQITAANVANLAIAWRWTSPDRAVPGPPAHLAPSYLYEGTPLMVNGALYTSTSFSQVAAIDASSGQTKWVFDPGVYKRRRAGDEPRLGPSRRRILARRRGRTESSSRTADASMFAVDAADGQTCRRALATSGRVDLTQGLSRPVGERALYSNTSPPVIVPDVIIVGSWFPDFPYRRDMPPGDVRGFDVRTGKAAVAV